MLEVSSMPIVQRALPEGDLGRFLSRPWQPLSRALFRAREYPQQPNSFPLAAVVAAPSDPAFLESLSSHLCIAEALDARPALWWLATPDGRFDYLVLSDAHRQSPVRGGQISMALTDPSLLTPQHEGVDVLCRTFEWLWGLPGDDVKSWGDWFSHYAETYGRPRWSRAPRPR